MAKDYRRVDAHMAQEQILLDDLTFLREIVGRVVQEVLEAEIPITSGLLLTSAA